MFGVLSRLVRPAFGVARGLVANPIVKTAAKATGVGATAYSVGNALFGGGNKMPALPPLPGLAPAGAATMGKRGIFQNDPNVAEYLKAFAIAKANLRTYYRAPKGFVVLKDEVGDAYGLPKVIAQKMGLWKPAKKPLLSIRDTNALRHAGVAIRKLQRAEKTAKKIANWHSPRPRKNIIVTGKVISRKAA